MGLEFFCSVFDEKSYDFVEAPSLISDFVESEKSRKTAHRIKFLVPLADGLDGGGRRSLFTNDYPVWLVGNIDTMREKKKGESKI